MKNKQVLCILTIRRQLNGQLTLRLEWAFHLVEKCHWKTDWRYDPSNLRKICVYLYTVVLVDFLSPKPPKRVDPSLSSLPCVTLDALQGRWSHWFVYIPFKPLTESMNLQTCPHFRSKVSSIISNEGKLVGVECVWICKPTSLELRLSLEPSLHSFRCFERRKKH